MKRNIITVCVAIFVFSVFVGQDFVVAQVNTCSDCDPRFVNASGDKIRKLTVKKDLRVKRNAFVDGKVGIGTTSPTSELTVKGEAGFLDSLSRLRVEIGSDAEGAWIDLNNSAGTPVAFLDVEDTGPYAGIGYIGVGKGEIVGDEEVDRVGITGDGGIFIKNGSQQNLLNIFSNDFGTGVDYGFIEVFGQNGSSATKITLNGNNGDVTATQFVQSSDVRLKENIHTIENALDMVTKLRGVHYEWIDKKSRGEGRRIGLIAQELEKVIPEVVSQDDEGMKSVAYSPLVGVLIEAIKQLKAENDNAKKGNLTLKSENEQLREKLTALADRQDALEAMYLAISTSLPKEKLVKLDTINIDEVQKTVQ